MKKTLVYIFMLCGLFAQAQNWTAAMPHVTSITGVPSASGSWIRLNTTTGQPYQWNPNTVSWVIMPDGIDVVTGSIPPAYTPTYQQSEFAINAVDSLYRYRSGAWRHINPGGSGGGATYTAGSGIAINGGNVISNTAPDQTVALTGAGINAISGTYPNFTITGTELDGNPTNEIQRIDTAALVGSTLRLSLLNDAVPFSAVDLSSLTPTTEDIQDVAGGMVSGNTETRIALTYDDAGGKINAVVEGNLSNYTNDAGFLTAEVDGSVTNELQDLTNASDPTSHTTTLSSSGGSIQLVEGANIGLATTGTVGNGIVTISTTGGVVPTGGTTGQVLSKIDGTDYNTQWITAKCLVFEFTTAQSNTDIDIPAGVQMVDILCIGGGGGGGSGRKGLAGSVRCGGGGGAGGGVCHQSFSIVELGNPTQLRIDVGAGGAAGAAQTTNSASGNPGGTGGTTAVETTANVNIVRAVGGGGGAGGTASAGTAGSASTVTMFAPGAGASASASGGNGASAATVNTCTPSGGGAGGGITNANTQSSGGGGGSAHYAQNAGGTSGAAGGTAGGPGNLGAVGRWSGSGGGGGGGNLTGNGGTGGAGARGAGGGGGGAAVDATGNSGAGGVGGVGYCRVTLYF